MPVMDVGLKKSNKFPKRNYIGETVNNLKVLSWEGRDIKGNNYWLCKCDCGNEKIVNQSLLNKRSAHCKECSYLGIVLKDKCNKEEVKKLYEVYHAMKQRCYNKNDQNYHNYGGRGIKVCEKWLESFSIFYKWCISNNYKPGLTIDRVQNDGWYCPDNCRFVGMKEQSRNKRGIVKIEYNGETKTLVEWSETFNINYNTLVGRYWNGWPIDKCIEVPVSKKSDYSEINYNGKTQSLMDWSRELKIHPQTLYARINKGLSGEELFKVINE